ncbi:helix-turn-helix domain-containing protein [Shewanella sp. FJAT-52076]|uniref:helix-turn-helix domain-containing protein n=1 Tax=Shewanella sp. FJAT-52076 TaxID=2864202 RepID=UPI001C659DC4|nr:helix-turn-helix transcriptional regulator [Shewanella sp. FJAT-52076]QYJ75321.1 helix-turn-helix domain-containing protein [Shewanella sp. FJAT-52076]
MRNQNPLPARLKAARTKLGISQKELGQRLGMDPGTASSRMNHYEKGRHMPDYDTLDRMAKELGVSVAYFFCQTESAAELVKLIEAMSEEQRKALLESIKHQQNGADTEQC